RRVLFRSLTPSSATYAGGTTIANGTLKLGNAAAATNVLANLTLGSAANTSGVIDLNGFSPAGTIPGVNVAGTGTGHQIINSNTTTASTVNLNLPADATFPGAVGGNLVFNKVGAATTLTLAGTVQPAATTTGVINVNAGTVVVNSGTPVSPGMSFSAAAGATMSFGTGAVAF